MSINKNNKNFQITLDPECSEILETLAFRYKTTKSIIIKNALKVYAANKKHNINISYQTQWNNSTLQKESKTKPKSKDEDWDKMLNELEQSIPSTSDHND